VEEEKVILGDNICNENGLNLDEVEEMILKAKKLEESQDEKFNDLEKRLNDTDDIKSSLEVNLADCNKLESDLKKKKKLNKESNQIVCNSLMVGSTSTNTDGSVNNHLDLSEDMIIENSQSMNIKSSPSVNSDMNNEANIMANDKLNQNPKENFDSNQVLFLLSLDLSQIFNLIFYFFIALSVNSKSGAIN